MSEPSAQAESSILGTSVFGSGEYELSSDLARLCLPSEYKDANRVLAWVDSICFLFLLIGLVGLKAPQVVVRPLSQPTDVTAIIFTPPEEQPKVQPEVKQDEPEPPDKPAETPQVVTVIAAADPSSVAFPVPVEGAVAVATARFATPPPPINSAPPKAVRFNPNASPGGSYPPPPYPGIALRNHYQGTTGLEFLVDPSGSIISVKLAKTSGHPELDENTIQWIKTQWRFPPGEARYLIWDCIYKQE